MNDVNSPISSSRPRPPPRSPDWTCAVAGSTRLDRRDQLLRGRARPPPATEIASNWPSRSSSLCAVGTSKTANVAVPSVSTLAVLRDPDELEACFGWSVAISTVSPTAKPSRSAVPASIDDLARPVGQRPSSEVERVERANSGAVSIPKPKLGAPLVLIALPSSRGSSC